MRFTETFCSLRTFSSPHRSGKAQIVHKFIHWSAPQRKSGCSPTVKRMQAKEIKSEGEAKGRKIKQFLKSRIGEFSNLYSRRYVSSKGMRNRSPQTPSGRRMPQETTMLICAARGRRRRRLTRKLSNPSIGQVS